MTQEKPETKLIEAPFAFIAERVVSRLKSWAPKLSFYSRLTEVHCLEGKTPLRIAKAKEILNEESWGDF